MTFLFHISASQPSRIASRPSFCSIETELLDTIQWVDWQSGIHALDLKLVWHSPGGISRSTVAIDRQSWGQELNLILDRVRIESLPPSCTMKHQPLDLGLIAATKISYRSVLLRAVLEVMDKKRSIDNDFKERGLNGKYGLQDGLLPHVRDAVMLSSSTCDVM